MRHNLFAEDRRGQDNDNNGLLWSYIADRRQYLGSINKKRTKRSQVARSNGCRDTVENTDPSRVHDVVVARYCCMRRYTVTKSKIEESEERMKGVRGHCSEQKVCIREGLERWMANVANMRPQAWLTTGKACR